jgi:uncharacterized protein YprB with RNaseH-like and TPR domain
VSKPRILFWDLETSNLDADFGSILCVGYKWADENKVNIISIDSFARFAEDPTDDREVVRAFLKVYSQADISVTYFGGLGNFDLPFFQAKILEHGFALPKKVEMLDLFYTAKSNLKISRKSMKNVAKFLKLKNQKEDFPLEGKVWRRARAGHAPSLRYVYKHCVLDILVLEELYYKLRPLIRTHPRLGPCRFCGSDRIQRRGIAVCRAERTRQRIQCQECAAWDLVPLKKEKKKVG